MSPRQPLAVLGFLFLLLASACSPSALRVQAQTALSVAGVARVAGETIDAARSAEMDAAEASGDVDALEAVAARWRPLGVSLDYVRTVLVGWVEELSLSLLAGSEPPSVVAAGIRAAQRLLTVWPRLVAAGEDLGLDLPAIPDFSLGDLR